MAGFNEVGNEIKVEADSGGDAAMATLTFNGEDHTLGNALRYTLIRKSVSSPRLPFCGHHFPAPRPSPLRFSCCC